MSDRARKAIECALERYLETLRRDAPASCANQRRPREEAAAYGLGMARALAALEDADGIAGGRSVALAVEVIRAARDVTVPEAHKCSGTRKFPQRATASQRVTQRHNVA